MNACPSEKESERLAALKGHQILDTAPEEQFDDLVRLAAHACGVPIAAVSLIDRHRQWFKAVVGLDTAETPRSAAFCAHTIRQGEVMVVPDAQADPRFADNPLVTGTPHIRFYAGVPLVTEGGHALGALCVIDTTPRTLTPEQEGVLRLLARQATSHLKAARNLAEREQLVADQERLILEKECLLAERMRLAAIVESSADAIISTDLTGRITSWNAGAERLYGYSAQEMIGQPQAALVPRGETGLHTNLVQSVVERGRVEGLEVVREHKGGGRRHVSLTLSALRDASGRVVGVSAVGRDITQKKEAEAERERIDQALQAERGFTRALLESLQEGIVACDADGTLTLFNRATREFHGLPEQSLPPDRWAEHFDLYHADGLTPMETRDIPLFRALQGEVVRDAEMVIAPKSGPARTLLASGRSLHGPHGEKLGAVVAMHDVSERRALEAERRDHAERLRQSEAGLRAVLESAPVILYAADAGGTVTLSEGTGLAALGLAPGEAVGRSVFDFSGGDAGVEANTRRALAGEAVSYDARVYGLCLHTELRPIRDGAGAVSGIIGVCFDLTERARAEERFRVLFEQSSDAHLLCGEDGVVDCNDATLALLRCGDKAQMLSLHPSALSPEFQPDGGRSDEKGLAMEALAREKGCHRFEWMHRKMDGEEFPVEVTLTPVTLAGGPVMLAVLHDLTERKRAEEQIKDHAVVLEFQKRELEKANAELAALATTDGLTGLSNHRAFQERLAGELNRAVRYGTPLSMILLDVDHFKQFNDTHGHPAGDAVLRSVARVLQDGARDTDLVARYGGEEFVLLLPETDLGGAAALAERLRAAVEEHPWPVQAVTASFGVAGLRLGEVDGAAVTARADEAMYQSKAAGRNRVNVCPQGVCP